MKEQANFNIKPQIIETSVSQEMNEILQILDVIENHTIELRKRIMQEISKDGENSKLKVKLEDIS